MALNAKQRLFVDRYLRHRNSARAAKEAGYSEKTAQATGSRLLHHVEVAPAIASGLKRATDRAELKAADVLAEIGKLAFVDITRAYDDDGRLLFPKDMPKDVRAALVSVETDELFEGVGRDKIRIGETKKVRFMDKIRALELLAKHFKLLTDVQSVALSGSVETRSKVLITMPSNGREAPVEKKETKA